MERKFIKFADWESKKYNTVTEDSDADNTKKEAPENPELHTRLAQVTKVRREAIHAKDDIKVQILDIEAKIIKLDIEKNDLIKKKAELESAHAIHKKTSKEGKTNVKEDE